MDFTSRYDAPYTASESGGSRHPTSRTPEEYPEVTMGSPHPHQLPVASAGGYAVSYSGSPYHQSSGNPMDAYPSSLLGDISHWSLSEGPVATTRGGSMPDSYSPFTRTLYPPANSESASSPYTTRYEHLLHDPRSPIPGLNTTLGGYVSPNYVANQVPVVPSHRYDARVVSAPRARHAGQFKVEEDEDSTIFAEFSDSTSSSSLLTSEFGTVSPHARLSPQPPWRHNPRVSPESSQSRLPVSEVTRVRSSTSASGPPQAIFECQFCGKAFGKRSNLKTHEENKHRPGHVRRFECEYAGCDRKFDRKMDLRRHVKSVHDKIRDIACEHCGQTFPRVDTKKRHAEHCPSRHFTTRGRGIDRRTSAENDERNARSNVLPLRGRQI